MILVNKTVYDLEACIILTILTVASSLSQFCTVKCGCSLKQPFSFSVVGVELTKVTAVSVAFI